jgi:O-6-methylguanine DNA methyltransferase
MAASKLSWTLADFEIKVSDQGLRHLAWAKPRASRQSQGDIKNAHRKRVEKAMLDYFSGRTDRLGEVQLDFEGAAITPRAKKVYQALQKTRVGETLSYAELAVRAGLPRTAARYVGTLMAKNPWPLFVPCHRVLPASSTQAGKKLVRVGQYSGGQGSRTKLELLNFERGLQ